jgi:phosphoribosylformylglycinamidine synthase
MPKKIAGKKASRAMKKAKAKKQAGKAKKMAKHRAGKSTKQPARKAKPRHAFRLQKPSMRKRLKGKPMGKLHGKPGKKGKMMKKQARAKSHAHSMKRVATLVTSRGFASSSKRAGGALLKTVQPDTRKPRCIVLAGFGLNAEAELAHSFALAGADASIVHFSDISSGRKKLTDYDIFAIPGGWSFGDDIAGGRVLSNKLKSKFRAQFEEFVSSGKPVLGVCNGFQTLVKLGALPNLSGSFIQESTLTFNKSGRFEDRWVRLKPQKSVCRYFEGVDFIHCPVRHGEGQFVARDQVVLDSLMQKGMVPIKYVDEKMREAAYPDNPNGSIEGIAGICNSTGKILGLMPHIECSIFPYQFPRFTAGISHEKASLRFFENIVSAAKKTGGI